jgi:hypothetical protein
MGGVWLSGSGKLLIGNVFLQVRKVRYKKRQMGKWKHRTLWL